VIINKECHHLPTPPPNLPEAHDGPQIRLPKTVVELDGKSRKYGSTAYLGWKAGPAASKNSVKDQNGAWETHDVCTEDLGKYLSGHPRAQALHTT
jgi:hypothetical protein